MPYLIAFLIDAFMSVIIYLTVYGLSGYHWIYITADGWWGTLYFTVCLWTIYLFLFLVGVWIIDFIKAKNRRKKKEVLKSIFHERYNEVIPYRRLNLCYPIIYMVVGFIIV